MELDMAKPLDRAVIDKYYADNFNSIIKRSPSSSTCSSMSSITKANDARSYKSGSSTATNSDTEELELDAIPSKADFKKYQNSSLEPHKLHSHNGNLVIVDNSSGHSSAQTSGPRIDSIAIQNSSDIQFGNKTFYNGPVVIKQFMLDDRNKKWISRTEAEESRNKNGLVNDGFDGPQDTVQNESQQQPDAKTEACNNHKTLKFRNFTITRKSFWLATSIASCALLGIILLIIFLSNTNRSHQPQSTLGDGDDSRKNIAIKNPIDNDLLLGNVLRLVSRDEWLAQPPKAKLTELVLPVNRVIIIHTATQGCESQAECTFRVRFMQTYHMDSRGWDDISYNFMVGGDGSVYEGRGWDQQGAHSKGFNAGSIAIAYIGTFITKVPNKNQLRAGFLLMDEGVKLGKLTKDYKIYGHGQLIPTQSPGDAFYELIKTWPHWTNATMVTK